MKGIKLPQAFVGQSRVKILLAQTGGANINAFEIIFFGQIKLLFILVDERAKQAGRGDLWMLLAKLGEQVPFGGFE